MSEFKCQFCGACCRVVGRLLPHLPKMLQAIFQPKPDGSCQHLQQNDDGTYLCDCYEDRPLVCRVDWMAQNKGPQMGLTEQAYFQMAAEACHTLRRMEEEANK